MPKKLDFEREISAQFASAVRARKTSIVVNAGELHRLVGVYPSKGHAMPTCCNLMHELFDPRSDEIIESPPKGRGASLTIRYKVPR